jgi:hypothetical protein
MLKSRYLDVEISGLGIIWIALRVAVVVGGLRLP